MSIMSLDYWLQWQVAICAVIFIIPTVVALRLIISKRRRRMNEQNIIKSTDLWIPCWRNLHPIWLLCFRASAFLAMVFLLYQTVANLGFFVFLFYTQRSWVLAVVKASGSMVRLHSITVDTCDPTLHRILHIAGSFRASGCPLFEIQTRFCNSLGTIISARGCWLYTRNPLSQPGERDKFLKKAVEENSSEQQLGLWENSMLIMYQVCAGAVMLTDIVFWCLLLPFMTGENFKLTLLIGLMHSVNAVFLLLDSVLSNLVSPTLSPMSNLNRFFGVLGVYMSAAYLGGRILSWNSTLHGRRYGISEWLWFTSLVTDYTVCLSELKTEYSRDCFHRHFLGRLTELPAVFQKVSMFKNMKFLVIKLGLDQCGGEIAMEKKHS
ncbi:putative protein phosphatase 2C 2-like [Capsicum annuum]|nr:putative protein phosphatase 2C 2-like [Capsicum annuum]